MDIGHGATCAWVEASVDWREGAEDCAWVEHALIPSQVWLLLLVEANANPPSCSSPSQLFPAFQRPLALGLETKGNGPVP